MPGERCFFRKFTFEFILKCYSDPSVCTVTDSLLCTAETKPLWIVSDIRRKTDIEWFKQNYGEKIKIIRITASDEVRRRRGWIFTEGTITRNISNRSRFTFVVLGVDDVTSECDLDDFLDWDLVIGNNDTEGLEKGYDEIIQLIKTYNI